VSAYSAATGERGSDVADVHKKLSAAAGRSGKSIGDLLKAADKGQIKQFGLSEDESAALQRAKAGGMGHFADARSAAALTAGLETAAREQADRTEKSKQQARAGNFTINIQNVTEKADGAGVQMTGAGEIVTGGE